MLSSLRSIIQEVNTAKDLQVALDITVRRVRDSMGTQVCTVYMQDPATERYILMATEGLDKAAEGNLSLAIDEGLVGQVAQREEPICLEDAESHPRFQ